MTWSPLGVYRPTGSWLHRTRPGAKLATLFLAAIVLMVFRTPVVTTSALVLVLCIALSARMPAGELLRTLRGFAIIAAMLFAFNAWQRGFEQAYLVVGSLMALIIASVLVTFSTRADEMVDTLTWALSPLRPVGVHPERVALAFSLTLRTIPTIFEIAHDTRQAARARGLERNLRAYATPLVIRSVLHAKLLGEALEARGVDDPGRTG